MMEKIFQGLCVSEGISIGKIFFAENFSRVLEIKIDNIEFEIRKLECAIQKSKKELENISNDIINTHLLMLDDVEFIKKIKDSISYDRWSAEYSVKINGEKFADIFEAMDNNYFRERAYDIRDVSQRIIRNLQGKNSIDFENLDYGTIIIAKDILPSDVARFNPEKISGIITAFGGKTSHSAIIAKNLGIPSVMGIGEEAVEDIKLSNNIIIDGFQGKVFVNPSKELVYEYENKILKMKERKKSLKNFIGKKTKTKDGMNIELFCNISSTYDLDEVLENDGEGIGLFRSEFIFMERSKAPSEDEQYEIYKKTLETMGGKPVIIRTMDIGGDKNIPYLNMSKEENPFLGYRAIRYCLKEPENFVTQIRALLRAGVYGNLKIMIPMISSLEEILEVKNIFNNVKKELSMEKIEFLENVPLGIMIEVPSAAICSDILAEEVDFFSIGTNDLIQYTVAADRMNQKVSDIYDVSNPAVLRLIKMTIDNGHKAGISVGMCGSAAGNLNLIPFFLKMGLDEFSVSPKDILKVREKISCYNRYDENKDLIKALHIK